MSTITPVDLRKLKENFAFYFISINIFYTLLSYSIIMGIKTFSHWKHCLKQHS